jgi:hypothetical protein
MYVEMPDNFMGRQKHKELCVGLSLEPRNLRELEERRHPIMRNSMPIIPNSIR